MKLVSLLCILITTYTSKGFPSKFKPKILSERPLPRFPRSRIVGGEIATQGQYPFMVSLQTGNIFGHTHACGGTILNANHILTAAHCVKGHLGGALNVVAGEQNLQENSGLEVTVKSEQFFTHDFTTTTGANDVAIIRTASNITLEEGLVELVPLPEDYQEPALGSICTAVGWGYTQNGGELSDDLRYVQMPYIPDAECEGIFGEEVIFLDSICAGHFGIMGVCNGDSGGPLLCDGVQTGIVSWGQDCDAYPAVFTQVSHYLDWIKLNVNS